MMRDSIQRWLKIVEKFLEDTPLYAFLVFFSFVVLILGLVYSVLTPYGQGLAQNSKTLSNATFLDGLYLSIVTVSSLGYGDVSPMGLSKAIACVEVLFGLAFMGIIIAKLTSRRISYHVKRLFSSDAQKRIEEFLLHFERTHDGLKKAMENLAKVYQRTPSKRDPNLEGEKASALSIFKESLSILHIKSAGLADYLSYEVQEGDYFGLAPIDAILRLGSSIDNGLIVLRYLMLSLSIEARIEVLDGDNRQRISETLDSQKTICQVVAQYSKDQDVNKCFCRILATCTLVPESIFIRPITVAAAEQPDLALEGSDEPQETSSPRVGGD